MNGYFVSNENETKTLTIGKWKPIWQSGLMDKRVKLKKK